MDAFTIRIALLSLCLAILVAAGDGRAELITWTGPGDGTLWRDGDNWDLNRGPDTDDEVIIDLTGQYVIVFIRSATVAQLDIAEAGAALRLAGDPFGQGAKLTIADGIANNRNIVSINADSIGCNVCLGFPNGTLFNRCTVDGQTGLVLSRCAASAMALSNGNIVRSICAESDKLDYRGLLENDEMRTTALRQLFVASVPWLEKGSVANT